MPRINVVPMFTPGSGGDMGRQRLEAARALQKSDLGDKVYDPAVGWMSVAARSLGGFLEGRAERENQAEEEAAWNPLKQMVESDLQRSYQGDSSDGIGGSYSAGGDFEAPAPRRGGSGGASRSAAANERASKAVGILTSLGYSPHAAAGVAGNLMHESGFNTHAVGDNGTAFGIAQWRGPRFKNLQRFAAQNGKDWRDFDTQVRFIDHEMRTGSDPGAARAFAALRGARDPGEAASAFMNHYERPAAWAAAQSGPKRAQYAMQLIRQGVPAAQAQAAAGITGEQYASGSGGMREAPPPDLRAYQQQMEVGLQMMQSQNQRVRAQGYQIAVQARQAMETAKERHRVEQMRMSETDRREAARDDRETRRFERQDEILRERYRREDEREERRSQDRNTPQSYREYRKRLEDPEYDKFMREREAQKGGGIEVITNPDGTTTTRIGGQGSQKLTEVQSKDLGFHDRALGAEVELQDVEDALRSYRGKYGGQVPVLGNLLKGDQYRQAEVSAKEFISAMLRKDTGAAVTPQEFELYGGLYLPQPGDDDKTLELKRAARRRAIKSMKKGLGTAQVLADSRPDLFDGTNTLPRGSGGTVVVPNPVVPDNAQQTEPKSGFEQPKPGDVIDGWRFKGGDPSRRESWERIDA